jgi:hypothetical protein
VKGGVHGRWWKLEVRNKIRASSMALRTDVGNYKSA